MANENFNQLTDADIQSYISSLNINTNTKYIHAITKLTTEVNVTLLRELFGNFVSNSNESYTIDSLINCMETNNYEINENTVRKFMNSIKEKNSYISKNIYFITSYMKERFDTVFNKFINFKKYLRNIIYDHDLEYDPSQYNSIQIKEMENNRILDNYYYRQNNIGLTNSFNNTLNRDYPYLIDPVLNFDSDKVVNKFVSNFLIQTTEANIDLSKDGLREIRFNQLMNLQKKDPENKYNKIPISEYLTIFNDMISGENAVNIGDINPKEYETDDLITKDFKDFIINPNNYFSYYNSHKEVVDFMQRIFTENFDTGEISLWYDFIKKVAILCAITNESIEDMSVMNEEDLDTLIFDSIISYIVNKYSIDVDPISSYSDSKESENDKIKNLHDIRRFLIKDFLVNDSEEVTDYEFNYRFSPSINATDPNTGSAVHNPKYFVDHIKPEYLDYVKHYFDFHTDLSTFEKVFLKYEIMVLELAIMPKYIHNFYYKEIIYINEILLDIENTLNNFDEAINNAYYAFRDDLDGDIDSEDTMIGGILADIRNTDKLDELEKEEITRCIKVIITYIFISESSKDRDVEELVIKPYMIFPTLPPPSETGELVAWYPLLNDFKDYSGNNFDLNWNYEDDKVIYESFFKNEDLEGEKDNTESSFHAVRFNKNITSNLYYEAEYISSNPNDFKLKNLTKDSMTVSFYGYLNRYPENFVLVAGLDNSNWFVKLNRNKVSIAPDVEIDLDVEIPLRKWFHMALVYSPNHIKVLLDGITACDTDYTCEVNENHNTLPRIFIGNEYDLDSSESFDGYLKNLRIYSECLTDDMIKNELLILDTYDALIYYIIRILEILGENFAIEDSTELSFDNLSNLKDFYDDMTYYISKWSEKVTLSISKKNLIEQKEDLETEFNRICTQFNATNLLNINRILSTSRRFLSIANFLTGDDDSVKKDEMTNEEYGASAGLSYILKRYFRDMKQYFKELKEESNV